jgi:hypothetical protein
VPKYLVLSVVNILDPLLFIDYKLYLLRSIEKIFLRLFIEKLGSSITLF